MGVPGVRLPPVRDYEDRYQRDARAAIKQLDSPGLRKITVPGIVLTTATSLVPHQLGKIPVGWLVIDKTAPGDVSRDPAVPQSADTIALRASATTTVTLQFW